MVKLVLGLCSWLLFNDSQYPNASVDFHTTRLNSQHDVALTRVVLLGGIYDIDFYWWVKFTS